MLAVEKQSELPGSPAPLRSPVFERFFWLFYFFPFVVHAIAIGIDLNCPLEFVYLGMSLGIGQ